MANPWDQDKIVAPAWGNDRIIIPGSGPKPPSGYGTPGNAQPLTYQPGGPNDPNHAAAMSAASARATLPIDIAKARAMAEIAINTKRREQDITNGGPAQLPQALDQLTGDDFLKAIPSTTAAQVKALSDGRMAFPSGQGLRSPYWQQMLSYVAHYDPTFDAVNYNARSKARQDFTSGQSARNIRALNTAIGHLGQLNTQLDGTASHGGFPFATTVNAAENALYRGSGNRGPTLFQQTAGALASELTQVFRGSGGAEADVKRYLDELNVNGSAEQKKAAMQNIAGLLQSRLEAIGDQYKQGMGKTIDPLVLLNPHAQQAFKAILPGGDDGSGAPGGLPGAMPPGIPPSGGGAPPSGGGMGPLATGPTKIVADPKAATLIDTLVRKGATADEINTTLKSLGFPGDVQQPHVDAIQAFLKANPGYTKSVADMDRQEPTTLLNRATASPLGTLVGSAVDAGMGGMADEVAGGVNSLVTGQPFSEAVAKADAAKQAAFAQHPVMSGIGNLIGSTTGAAIGANALGGGALASVLGRAAPYAGAAAYGAASGAGQDNNNRVLGATIGAAAGPLGVAGGKLLAIPFGAAARSAPVAAITNRARGMFGRQPMMSAPTPSAAEITAAAAATKAGIPDIRASLSDAQGLGVPMSLADTHPELRELAGAAVRRSPTASAYAESQLIPRGRGQIDRFGNAVTRDLGPIANIPQVSEDLTSQARAAAGPLYDKAYAAPGASAVKLDDLMQRPSMQGGLSRAYSIAKEEGRDPTALGFDLDPQGNVTLTRVPSFQTLDYVKRGLDDTLEPHRNPITGKLQLNEATRAINGTKNTLLSRIDAVNPDYAAARQTYSGPVQSRDALARGQDALTLNPDELGMQVANQSPEHMGQMQTGYRSALMDAANRVRYSTNPFDATLGTPAAEQRLSALYPNNPGTARLLQQRDMERNLASSSNSILGNSKTAQRMLADQSFDGGNHLGDLVDAGVNVAMGQVPTGLVLKKLSGQGIKDAWRMGVGKRAVAKADDLAPLLMNPDPAAAGMTLDDLLGRMQSYRDFVNQSRPTKRLGMFGAGLGSSAAQGF